MFRSYPIPFMLAVLAAGCTAQTTSVDSVSEGLEPHGAVHSRDADRTPEVNRKLAALRQATARFQNFAVAQDAGYTRITPCWEHSTRGAMGYHYGRVQPADWDIVVDLLDPELLMYEPGPAGQMRLVGMEYVVPKAAWDAEYPGTVPSLLGMDYHPHSSLPIYKLHIWLWRDNPAGIFADWNPKVSCAHADETDTFQ